MTYRWMMKLSGAKDPEKGARALVRGVGVVLLLNIVANIFMFNSIFPEIKGPALNTSMPFLLCGLITTFSAQFIGSFLVAFLARSFPLRHALLAGIPFLIGSIFGTFLNWTSVPLWHFPAQGLVALAGTGVAGFLAAQCSTKKVQLKHEPSNLAFEASAVKQRTVSCRGRTPHVSTRH